MRLRIKGVEVVKPAKATWNGILPLSLLDQISPTDPNRFIYIYNKPSNSHHLISIIDTLKDSLSRVLVPYHPIAGRLRRVAGGKLELHCNSAGADLIEAESNLEISDLGDLSTLASRFQELVPYAEYMEKPFHELPLLAVQLTSFRCGGLVLSLALSHVLADGSGTFNFIRDWAKLARGEPLDNPPYLDRCALDPRANLIKDASIYPAVGNVESFFPTLPTLIHTDDKTVEDRKNDTILTAILFLTKTQVDELKKVANMDKGEHDRPYSRFEAISAHVWRCISKARNHTNHQITALCFCADGRGRMDPPLPTRYFGNAIVDVKASSQVRELITRPLSHACRKIRKATQSVTNDYIRSLIEFLHEQKSLSPYQDKVALGTSNPNIAVVSWLTLSTRGMDFGMGDEIYFGPSIHGVDGEVVILPGYKHDDGSVAVAVWLPVTHMGKFKNFFYNDLCMSNIQSRI